MAAPAPPKKRPTGLGPVRQLLFGTKKQLPTKAKAHPLEKGDLCLAVPPKQLAGSSAAEQCLATVVDYAKKAVVFFDDGSETEQIVASLVEAPLAERESAKQRYIDALLECKLMAAMGSDEIIDVAIEKVKQKMGGTLGDDGMVSYTAAAGDESKEGQLLCEALIGNFGALAACSPAVHWMSTHWSDVCKEADTDGSGTISTDEAALIWDRVSSNVAKTVTEKLDVLGTPARLYRGDLCLAYHADSDPTCLATYVDSTHVVFFDGAGDVETVSKIEPATPAAKEQAILRYTKAVAQCKSTARKPSDQVVRAAIAAVRKSHRSASEKAIHYRASGEPGKEREEEEGHCLINALVDNFGALKAESAATAEIVSNWKVACHQADSDESGTISLKEAVAIWDRIVIEMTRTFTAKLDKLGVNPVPLVLSKGDLCVVKAMANDNAGHSDPNRVYLATYVDETHAIFFDDADEEPHEVAKIGPATAADKDVAIVKYSQALQQCMRLANEDATEVVNEAIEDVNRELGGKNLGSNGQIDYKDSAGEEAREGQLLCEALVSNLGSLWDESRSVNYMVDKWRLTCEGADEDKSGTISVDEAVEIWENVLSAFTQFALQKLEALGAATRSSTKKLPVEKVPAAAASVEA